jgi:hypothetical protein
MEHRQYLRDTTNRNQEIKTLLFADDQVTIAKSETFVTEI